MTVLQLDGSILYDISDITAGVFLVVLIASITRQKTDRHGLPNLLAAAVLILAGLFMRISAGTLSAMSGSFIWRPGMPAISSSAAPLFWVWTYILIAAGIFESATHVIYVEGGSGRKGLASRLAAAVTLAIAATVGFLCLNSVWLFTLANLILFLICTWQLKTRYPGRVLSDFIRAAAPALITYVIALFISPLRLTGPGLAVMLFIMNEQYQQRIREELAEKEAELARKKVQFLTEQISPHYIYNSLQSIGYLCGNDPAKAKEALDDFSVYLRGNLESITEEGLIPFERELEHTRAYIELERLSGRTRFEVEYELGVTDFMLPPLVLQPVVENALRYGSADDRGVVVVTITTAESDGAVIIEVANRLKSEGLSDVVRGEADEGFGGLNKGKSRSVGLDNVRARLEMQIGGTLEMESTGDDTKATIILPNKISQIRS